MGGLGFLLRYHAAALFDEFEDLPRARVARQDLFLGHFWGCGLLPPESLVKKVLQRRVFLPRRQGLGMPGDDQFAPPSLRRGAEFNLELAEGQPPEVFGADADFCRVGEERFPVPPLARSFGRGAPSSGAGMAASTVG